MYKHMFIDLSIYIYTYIRHAYTGLSQPQQVGVTGGVVTPPFPGDS